MSILPNSQPVSYSLFPPLLMLPAPKVAGLLGSGTPQPDPATFTFTDPRLATLNADERQKFADAAQNLLNVALRFAADELNEDALRAAQVLFHRKLTGHSPKRPLTPTAFKAEGDADMLDVMLNYEKRRDDLDSTFDRRFAEGMATLRSGKAANHA